MKIKGGWHRDAAIVARMAEQSASTGSVLNLHMAASAKQAEDERQKNRSIQLKFFLSIYFLAKISFHTPRSGEVAGSKWR